MKLHTFSYTQVNGYTFHRIDIEIVNKKNKTEQLNLIRRNEFEKNVNEYFTEWVHFQSQ